MTRSHATAAAILAAATTSCAPCPQDWGCGSGFNLVEERRINDRVILLDIGAPLSRPYETPEEIRGVIEPIGAQILCGDLEQLEAGDPPGCYHIQLPPDMCYRDGLDYVNEVYGGPPGISYAVRIPWGPGCACDGVQYNEPIRGSD